MNNERECPLARSTEAPASAGKPRAPVRGLGPSGAAVGTPLPADYRRWVATYGSGVIDRFLLIVNPFDLEPGVTFPEHVGMMLWGINRQRQLFGVRYPVAFFPEPGGFLPCGATENGSLLGWRTVGRPDDWPMMVTDDHYQTFRDLGASSLPDVVIDLLTLRSPAFEDCLPKRPSSRGHQVRALHLVRSKGVTNLKDSKPAEPAAAADRGRITPLRGMMSLQRPRLLSGSFGDEVIYERNA